MGQVSPSPSPPPLDPASGHNQALPQLPKLEASVSTSPVVTIAVLMSRYVRSPSPPPVFHPSLSPHRSPSPQPVAVVSLPPLAAASTAPVTSPSPQRAPVPSPQPLAPPSPQPVSTTDTQPVRASPQPSTAPGAVAAAASPPPRASPPPGPASVLNVTSFVPARPSALVDSSTSNGECYGLGPLTASGLVGYHGMHH